MEVSVFTAFFLSPCLGKEDTTHKCAPGGKENSLLKTSEHCNSQKRATIEIMPPCTPVRK